VQDILCNLLGAAWAEALNRGRLPLGLQLPPLTVELPRQAEHGDFASSLALRLAKKAGMKPRRLAEIIVEHIRDEDGVIAATEIAGPGFINFFIAPTAWLEAVPRILKLRESYGQNRLGAGRTVLLEYVSANPTGPLHVGHGRGAAFGDALARLLRAGGFTVLSEYYLNDAGNQMDTLGRSLLFRACQLKGGQEPFPDNHYQGDYINDLARLYLDLPLVKALLPADEPSACRRLADWAAGAEPEMLNLATGLAAGEILAGIKKDLADFGITLDSYFSEKSLLDSGQVDQALARLGEAGFLYESEGALWFASSRLGDDKDRVLKRSSGHLTYFAGDIAYHLNKIQRGYSRLIDIWGADHHGYVPRLQAALRVFKLEGDDPLPSPNSAADRTSLPVFKLEQNDSSPSPNPAADRTSLPVFKPGENEDVLSVLLVQMVRLLRGGELVPMSTRGGQFVTLAQVVAEVGRDSARFIFLSRRLDAGLDFDLELAKQKSMDNPVFYVQYAHTRVCSLLRRGREKGLEPAFDPARLLLPEEISLAKLMCQYPQTVKEAAADLEPHRLSYYLRELARMFHSYYNDQAIIQAGEGLAPARLALAAAVGQVLKNGLGLLGISAPEQM
jgi:arginyl-tRNA synthetase